GPTGHWCEDEKRKELSKAQEPEHEGCGGPVHAIVAARYVVSLVADQNDHRQGGERCQKARQPEAPVIRDRQRRSRFRRIFDNGISHAHAMTGATQGAKRGGTWAAVTPASSALAAQTRIGLQ